jgi:hypothetical protein
MRPAPIDRGAYLRARWAARTATAVLVAVAAAGVLELVVRARAESEQVRASGAWAFFQLSLGLVVLGWVTVRLWQRSAAARPLRLHVDDGPGARFGVPELDEPVSAPHVGLHGLVEPPRRW